MDLIIQQNRGQCLVTAHAMCMGMPVAEVLEEIGHDGMERIHPHLEEPFCFRGFHEQEIIDHAFQHDTAIIHIDALPGSLSGGDHDEPYIVQFKRNGEAFLPEDRVLNYLYQCKPRGLKAIILGKSITTDVWHAVAWDGVNIFDPNGKVYSLDQAEVNRFGSVIGLLLYIPMEIK